MNPTWGADPRSTKDKRPREKRILMCSLRSLTCLQVQVLPRQWMVGPSSHSRLWLGETPTGASSAINDSQRREGEANGPQGQRPARVSRGGPSWTEFVRLADQAVVAIAGADMINRADPRWPFATMLERADTKGSRWSQAVAPSLGSTMTISVTGQWRRRCPPGCSRALPSSG